MNSRIQLSRLLGTAAPLALVFCLSGPAAHAQPAGAPGTTITVKSLADGNLVVFPGDPYPCTLRDAIKAANMNKAVGGCAAGMAPHIVSATPLKIDFIDRIVFDVGKGTPRIQLTGGLPAITEAVTIDGATGGATRIEIAGGQVPNFFTPGVSGLLVTGTYSTLKSLVINGFRGHGIALTHEDGEGIVIVTPAKPERPQPGPGTLPGDPCGPQAFPVDPSQCPPGGGPNDDVSTIGALSGGGNTVLDCLIGTDASGTMAVPNGNGTPDTAGIALLSPGNTVGGTAPGARNVISGNRGFGVLVDDRNNHVIGNLIGTGVTTNLILGNQLDGVFVAGGQYATASGEIRDNTIANNGYNGVDAGYNDVSVLYSSLSNGRAIYGHAGLGIERGEAGVEPNDPSGLRNRPPNFPILQASTVSLTAGTTIFGQITQLSSSPITLQFFYNTACDPTGYGEGWSYIGSTAVPGGAPTLFQFQTHSIFLRGYFTATATTVHGTSEFSACLGY